METKTNSTVTIYGQIYKTYDYSLFNNVKGNRKLSPANYARLFKSFQEEQLVIPILVNNKYEIIDGQHRKTVCQELNLPIYYFIVPEYGSEQLARAQVSASWINKDYLHRYAEEGVEDYVWFQSFVEENGISVHDAQNIICNLCEISSNKIRYQFENGQFTVEPNVREKMYEFVTALEDFSFFEFYKSKSFVSAFLDLYFYENYNHTIMKNKLKTRKSALVKQVSKYSYLEFLTSEIYSFKSSGIKIFYNKNTKSFYKM